MTEEEAIYELSVNVDYKTPQIQEACQVAIKALEQQPCEDAISRQEVLDQAVDYGSNTYLIPVNSVKTLPPVTPKEKTGHWYIREMYSLECNSWECSECKEVVYEKTKYCPNCGARMVSE